MTRIVLVTPVPPLMCACSRAQALFLQETTDNALFLMPRHRTKRSFFCSNRSGECSCVSLGNSSGHSSGLAFQGLSDMNKT